MKTTKKGLSTKENILIAAKRLFLKYGFDDTSLTDVCKKSKTNLGTLTYYFPKKSDLISEIYKRYREQLWEFVLEKKPDEKSGRNKYAYFVSLYYYQIYSNENIRKFHYECLRQTSMDEIYSNTRMYVAPLIFNAKDPDIDLLIYADTAIRRQFNTRFYLKGDFSFDAIKELVREIHIVNSRLFVATRDEITAYLDNAFKFVADHLDCKITLL